MLVSHAELLDVGPISLERGVSGLRRLRRFSAFDIPRIEGGGPAHLRHVPRDALIRVAGFLALDPEGLVSELQDLRIVAERARQTTSCSNASDWVAAVHDTNESQAESL